MVKQFILLAFIITLLPTGVFADPSKQPSTQQQRHFFEFLLPKVREANRNIMQQRQKLIMLYHKHQQKKLLSKTEKIWLANLYQHYVYFDEHNNKNWQELLTRVDVVPSSMALAQADKETAAGTTRFAQKGHNYFGTWCYSKDCGLIPKERAVGAKFEVKKYPDALTSVRDYMHNLNSNPAYAVFRRLRQQQRKLNEPLSGILLTAGLLPYSTQRMTYVNDVRRIIERFGLQQYDAKHDDKSSLNQANSKQSFQRFLQQFRQIALRDGINKNVLNTALPKLQYLPQVIYQDRHQAEFSLRLDKYLQKFVDAKRVAVGREKLKEKKFQAIAKHYQVPIKVLMAIWGIESDYGKRQGLYPVLSSLATLAYDGRRANFFREQLIAALRIVQQKGLKSLDMLGSWAGAMGQCQFLPKRYLRYAVAYQHEDDADIWKNSTDAVASMANFLKKQGWLKKAGIAVAVKLPANLARKKLGLYYRNTIKVWKKLGVTLLNGKPLPAWVGNAAIIFPEKDNPQKAYLVSHNFNVLMRWNASYFYALAVKKLAASW